MGSVAQAVLEFDEAVQVPWRPPLTTAPALTVVAATRPGGRPHAARAARLSPPAAPVRTASASRERGPAPAGVPGAVCARCGTAGSCPPGPLRLTRRARRLLALLIAGGAVAAAAWVGGGGSREDAGLQLVGDAVTVVQPGDTLWSIARSVAGDADVRGVVDEIQRLNALEGSALHPGQVLELP